MPSNIQIACLLTSLLGGMFLYTFQAKQQFFPTVVYLSRSGAANAIFYALLIIWGLIIGTVVKKIFFGDLRPTESERLAERSWYTVTETCLAFTIFKEETVPVFVLLFAFLIFIKTFHWLTEERVDLIGRSLVMPVTFHVRILSVFFILGAIDTSLILYAYEHITKYGPTIQVVFGFEYSVLLVMLSDYFIKYVLYIHGCYDYSVPETRAITQMYVTVVLNAIKFVLYACFFGLMVQISTFPLFICRPMYFSFHEFRKSLRNVWMMRRAYRYLNNFYPDVTERDLESIDACIICREDLNMAAKKLPCGHLFHTVCLRSWFQRQQTCPTCRFSILLVPENVQIQRMRAASRTEQTTQTEEVTGNSCSCYFLHRGPCRIQNVGTLNATDEELVRLEFNKREELKMKIKHLHEINSLLETVSSSMSHAAKLHPIRPITNQQQSSSPKDGTLDHEFIRQKRVEKLLEPSPPAGKSTDNN